jgi:predicted nucleic acid-binding Zn ribbon protein
MTTIYYVHTFNERTQSGDHKQVVATSPDEAMTMVERTGIDYTSAQVSTDPYGIDVIAEYSEPCDTCTESSPTVHLRDNGQTQCQTCWIDALAYGHYHGLHQDQDGEPELVAECPACNGKTPSHYRT